MSSVFLTRNNKKGEGHSPSPLRFFNSFHIILVLLNHIEKPIVKLAIFFFLFTINRNLD